MREFFGGLIALAKTSKNWKIYVEKVNIAYPKYDETLFIPFDFDEEEFDKQIQRSEQKFSGFDKQLKGLLSVPPEKQSD